jgi:hypothetical protein
MATEGFKRKLTAQNRSRFFYRIFCKDIPDQESSRQKAPYWRFAQGRADVI